MSGQRLRALVVDDEPNIRTTLSMYLETLDCEVHAAAGAREALAVVERRPFDLVFLDLRLGQADGMALLPELLQRAPGLAVVVITAFATIESAVQAIKAGAQDYLPKLFTPDQYPHRRGPAPGAVGPGEPGGRPRGPARGHGPRRGGRDPIRGPVAGPRYGAQGRRGEHAGPPEGRERDGKGGARPPHPRAEPPLRAPAGDGELPHAHRRAPGERALRPRARRVHRGGAGPAGQGGGGRRRHALPRRGRRYPAVAPDQAAPLRPGPRVRAGWRHPDAAGGRAAHRRHQPGFWRPMWRPAASASTSSIG